MQIIVDKIIIPIEEDGPQAYLRAASACLHIAVEELALVKILSKALDLRNQEQFFYKMVLVIRIADSRAKPLDYPEYQASQAEQGPRRRRIHDRPIVVGFGPAGMFAALELIDHGLKPIVFERGKRIEERAVDVQNFIADRTINTESNIQFGEGGAGSYSDGKLFSRRNNNSSPANKVLKTFVKFGAPEEIEYISKPHLGTDVLCKIVANIRKFIIQSGGEIHFSAKMTDIIISDAAALGIVINNEAEHFASTIFIALGHSARDTFAMLQRKGIALEQKSISVGLRIEHPAAGINLLRYGEKYKNFKGLGAASYSLNHTNRQRKRGVYTFGRCPGGEIVNASSSEGMLAVNGMSESRRSSPYSNAALVVSCHKADYKSSHPLAGIEFQQEIERKSFIAGGANWSVPGQNLLDFLDNKISKKLIPNSYKMGSQSANMRAIFPDFVIEQLLAAFNKWKQEVPLFISHEAVLLGAETRTSSPLRIQRKGNFESINTKNLYPIGEGSGHSGGITSSAADAIKAVRAALSPI